MSQIEQHFRVFLSKKPEIESCYQEGLINRRSLARYLIRHGLAKSNQMEAVIAMLRRFEFKKSTPPKDLFHKTKLNIKDKVIILDFEKRKELVQKLQHLIATTNYDRGDTLKIVVGSSSVKLFLDEENEGRVKTMLDQFKIKHRSTNISEISVIFPEEAGTERGIIAAITTELSVNDIIIVELLTATPELLIYLHEKDVLEAYSILKRLQKC